ncbi:GHKL domain-containing protein [Enterococcus faecalis]|nr:GHKL domain-containing protein [Enterococcus faecalis]EHH1657747.1 GHKL domain-containing protein [Enterococcus faecalis]
MNSFVTVLFVIIGVVSLASSDKYMDILIPLTYVNSFLFIYYGSNSSLYAVLTVMLNYLIIQISMIFSFDIVYIFSGEQIWLGGILLGSFFDCIFFSILLYILYRMDRQFQVYFLLNKLSGYLKLGLIIFSITFFVIAILQAMQTNLNHTIYWFYNLLLLLLAFIFFGSVYSIVQITRYFGEINQLNIIYSQEIEKLEDIKSFRHDYRNLLLTLTIYLKSNKVEEAIHLLEEITSYSESIITDTILKDLKNIQILPLKSILFTKIQKALNQQLDVKLEVVGSIEKIEINLLDFIRVASILIDNAIEAAQKAKVGTINLKIMQYPKELLMEVENSFDENDSITVKEMIKKGVSTKVDHSGLGLSYLVKMANRYPNFDFKIDKLKETVKVSIKVNTTLR